MKAQVTFGMVPDWVIYSSISDRAVRLFAVLWSHADKEYRAHPGRKLLAELVHVKSVKSIDRAMKELIDIGAVTVHHRFTKAGAPRSNDYVVNATPDGATQMGLGSEESLGGDTPDATGSPSDVAQNQTQLEPDPENEIDRVLPFDAFWDLYPKRHAKKIGKRQTESRWNKLSEDDRAAAMVGVRHYRAACDQNLTLAKDPERFLRGRVWEDWQEPAVASSNGHRPSAPEANSDWSDAERGLA